MDARSDKSADVSLSEAWSAFERWLSEYARSNFDALREPTESVDLAAVIGADFPLHNQIYEWLMIHDGYDVVTSGGSTQAFIPGTLSPYSANSMAAAYQQVLCNIQESIEDGYDADVVGFSEHPLWVPFARSASGDQLMIDHRERSFGEVLRFSH